MAELASFWAGNPLSKIEQTGLASFVYHGHSMTLFVYDMDLKVPEGVVKRDANEIIPERRLFKIDNSYGPFADMFRYKMIKDTGLMWTDTDNICLRSDWNFDEYCFGMQGGPHKLVANGIIKAPKDSEFIAEMVEVSDSFDKRQIKWGEIGPQLITPTIHKYNLDRYIQEPTVFYPVDYWNWEHIWINDYRDKVFELCKNSYTLQIWNQMTSRAKHDKNNLPPRSAIHFYYKKYVEKSL